MKSDWRHSYSETVKRLEADLLTARYAGARSYQFGDQGRRINPQRLTLAECSAACREHATKILNRAVISKEAK